GGNSGGNNVRRGRLAIGRLPQSSNGRKRSVGRRTVSRKRTTVATQPFRTGASARRRTRVSSSTIRRTNNIVSRALRSTQATVQRARVSGTPRRPLIQRQSQSQQRSLRARRN